MENGISFPIQGNKNPPNRKSSLRDHERPVSQTAKSARDSRAGNEGMSTGSLYSDVLLRTAKGTRCIMVAILLSMAKGTRNIMESMRSSPHRADIHRISALNCSSPYSSTKQKQETPDGVSCFWYGERDSNPRPTDS